MLSLKDIVYTLTPGTPMERKLFSGLNLELQKGECCTLIGGNGAGKSSLFRLIQGDIQPDSGQVFRPKGGLSQVVQDPRYGTMEHLTIEENMAFAYKKDCFRGFAWSTTKKRQEFFRERLALLGMNLEDRLQDLVKHLSGGQRQALSLVMAFLTPSELILLDEITGALDQKSAERVLELAHKFILAEKKTCLMITHQFSQALTFGTRMVVLKDGKLSQDVQGEEKNRYKPSDLSDLL